MRVVLAVIAALGIVALACSDGSGGEVTPTSTARPSSTPTPVIVATPTVALAIPEWIPADLFGVLEWGQQFIADTVSGKIWELEYSGERRLSYSGSLLAAWLPDGEALVSVTDGSRITFYRGAPGEPLRQTSTLELSNSSAVWRSSGWASNGEILALASGLITDLKTGDIIAELDEPARAVIGWSGDSRYVAFVVGSGIEREVLVWKRDSGLTERISTWSAVWSSAGARLAYGLSRPDPADTGPFEVRVRDFSVGTDIVVGSRETRQSQTPVAWSADDRFLAISLYTDGNHTLIIDMAGERGEVFVPHAEPHSWLGASHTLLATGDSCEYTAGVRDHVVTVEADGSGLRRYSDGSELELYPRASPDGRLVAFDAGGGEKPYGIHLLTLATGEITMLATGGAITLFQNSIDPALVWSSDSRYVAFGVAGGHDC